jgi:hypothetical protein
MQNISVNGWAVLAAAASSFVVGGIWYSPMGFLKTWMKMSGVSQSQMKSGFKKAILGDVFSATAMACVLGHTIRFAGATELSQGLYVTAWCWLGFVAAIQIGSVTYERKPLKFFAINSGYRLVTMMIMGAILTLWN